MKTLLLLAGRSTRFWPLTEKTLFPLCGQTLLEHQVGRLRAGGCTDIILVGGAHNLEAAKAVCPDLPTIEQADLSLGMRGALLSALPACGDEPVCIVGGNDVIEPSAYQDAIAAAQKVEGGAILAQQVMTYFPGGYLTVDGDRITGIQEKPGAGNEPSDLVNIVTHIHNQPQLLLAALQDVDESTDDGYEQALATLFTEKAYAAVPYTGTWQAVKYPWHLLQLLPFLLPNEQVIDPTADIHDTAVIDGSVVIGPEARIFPHATIKGPCYIGARSIVANNALVRSSSVGDDCVVGYNTEVKGSVLHSHVWTHMTYIGDSVIGRNVSFGAGCTTGNFRLDEATITSVVRGEKIDSGLTKLGAVIGANTRLGIQVGINPGVKIGGESFIAGGTYIGADIPEKSFVYMKDGVLTTKENREAIPTPEEREQYLKQVQA